MPSDDASTPSPARTGHDDLCFGCGLTNPFGLQLELEAADAGGGLAGRFFVKQDHQGPTGLAHVGVLAAALVEAMSLAVGDAVSPSSVSLELEHHEAARVGTYLHATARLLEREGSRRWAAAELRADGGEVVADGKALFTEPAGV